MNPDFATPLQTLKDWQLAVFTAAQAERLFPNYALFASVTDNSDASVTDNSDASVMRLALDKVWDQLCSRGNCNVETQQSKVEEQTPDVEAFDMYGVYPALDAAVAITASLEQLVHPSAEEALNIAQLSEESIATYLEVTADPDMSDVELVRYINTHELMDQQQRFTQQLIDTLQSMNTPQASLIDEIRELAANQGVSNIGICEED